MIERARSPERKGSWPFLSMPAGLLGARETYFLKFPRSITLPGPPSETSSGRTMRREDSSRILRTSCSMDLRASSTFGSAPWSNF